MIVKCYCSWDTFKAGEEYEVSPEEGNMLICTGVAVAVELDAVKKREKKGGFVEPPKKGKE